MIRYRKLNYHYTLLLASKKAGGQTEYWLVNRVRSMIAQSHWRPAADIYESANAIHAILELAGIEPTKTNVTLYKDTIVIEGERYLRPPREEAVYYVAEIRQGPFQLEISLPATVSIDHVDAHYEQGLLHLIMTKSLS